MRCLRGRCWLWRCASRVGRRAVLGLFSFDFHVLLEVGGQREVRLVVGKGQRLLVVERLEIVHRLEVLPDLLAGDFPIHRLAQSIDDANHEKVLRQSEIVSGDRVWRCEV